MDNTTATVILGIIIMGMGFVTGYVLYELLGAVLVALGYCVVTLVFLGAIENDVTYGPHQ